MSASNHPGDVLSAQALEAVVTAAPLPIISVDLEGCVISLFPSDAQTAETLLHRADAAMYQAKGRGKNRYALFGEV